MRIVFVAFLVVVLAVGLAPSLLPAMFTLGGQAAAASTAAPLVAATPNTNEIRRNILRKLRWSKATPKVNRIWFFGHYAEVSYRTGESGGTAFYSDASGSWRLVCGGGGAVDRQSAVSVCVLSARDAAGLLPI